MSSSSSSRNISQVQQSGAASLVPVQLPPGFDLKPGATFGERFKIVKLIAHGGMGSVYLALDTNTGDEVCLKLIRPELVSTEEAMQRFLAEGKLARRLSHPNIAKVFDIDKKDGVWFISMEYARGITLRDWLSGRRRDGKPSGLSDVLWFSNRILRVLAHLHRNGIIHRDIKPGNIILAAPGGDSGRTLKLVDFGLAREVREDALRHTMTGLVVGTLGYMSPEQRTGGHVDERSDLYSVAVIVYEMLTGVVYDGHWEPVSSMRSDVPSAVDDVLKSSLSKFPDSRPSSAGDLLVQLQNAASQPTEEDESSSVPLNSERGQSGSRSFGKSYTKLVAVALLLLLVTSVAVNVYFFSKAQRLSSSASWQIAQVQDQLLEAKGTLSETDQLVRKADEQAQSASESATNAWTASDDAAESATKAKSAASEVRENQLAAANARDEAQLAQDTARDAASDAREALKATEVARMEAEQHAGNAASRGGGSSDGASTSDVGVRAERAARDAEAAKDAAEVAASESKSARDEAQRAASNAEDFADEAKGIRGSGGAGNVPAGKESWRQIEIGMSKQEVRRLLGEPASRDTLGTGKHLVETWYYNENARAWEGCVEFDHEGRVEGFTEPPN